MDTLLRPTEVSARLGGTPVGTLAYWRHTGVGPRWAKLGRRIVYRESDVLAYLDEQFAKTG